VSKVVFYQWVLTVADGYDSEYGVSVPFRTHDEALEDLKRQLSENALEALSPDGDLELFDDPEGGVVSCYVTPHSLDWA
jgi:hypothetical protein